MNSLKKNSPQLRAYAIDKRIYLQLVGHSSAYPINIHTSYLINILSVVNLKMQCISHMHVLCFWYNSIHINVQCYTGSSHSTIYLGKPILTRMAPYYHIRYIITASSSWSLTSTSNFHSRGFTVHFSVVLLFLCLVCFVIFRDYSETCRV